LFPLRLDQLEVLDPSDVVLIISLDQDCLQQIRGSGEKPCVIQAIAKTE
jgi:hypothetical protein